MKILKISAIVLAVLAVIVFAGGLLLPRQYEVSRSLLINAGSDRLFPVVATLSEWPMWSAWTEKKFPGMVTSYSGAASGVGAKSAWQGEASGNGAMEITRADPQSGITYTLELEGFHPSQGSIEFVSQDTATKVTMRMRGDLGANPAFRWFGLMMDGMMGKDFEEGLQGLKRLAEAN
jgi:hypothetical protein